MIYEKMIEKGIFNIEDASVDTIQRYIRNSGIRNGKTTITKERRAWEFAHSCDGYEADICHTFISLIKTADIEKHISSLFNS